MILVTKTEPENDFFRTKFWIEIQDGKGLLSAGEIVTPKHRASEWSAVHAHRVSAAECEIMDLWGICPECHGEGKVSDGGDVDTICECARCSSRAHEG
jgi:hypothetical protein